MSEMCLKDEKMTDYLEGRLSGRDLGLVEEHLSECDACLEVVVAARGVVRGADLDHFDPVPEGVTARTIRSCRGFACPDRHPGQDRLARMKEWFQSVTETFSLSRLSPAPIRGTKKEAGQQSRPLKKNFPGFRMELEIERSGKGKSNLWVRIMASLPRREPVRASLFREGREVASSRFKDSGVLFEDVPFGRYTLVFLRRGAKMREYPFEIKETANG